MPQKITPFIRCDNNWKEVAEYYVDVFWADAKIVKQNPAVTEVEIFWQSLATLIGWPYPWAVLNPSVSFSWWNSLIIHEVNDMGDVMINLVWVDK